MKTLATVSLLLLLALPVSAGEWALTTGSDTYDDPEWCEDFIIMYSDRDPSINNDIWVVEVDGAVQPSDTYRVYQSATADCQAPTWEYGQCGFQFFFQRTEGGPAVVHVATTMNATFSEPITLGNANDMAPDRSGVEMLVHSDREGNNDIVAIDHGGEAHGADDLTTDPADDRNACWSPDENWIAFASDRSGNWDIWVMSAQGEGDNLRQLTDTTDDETMPAWSPTGEFIAFARAGAEPGIWVSDAWGRTQYHVTDDVTDSSPTWSDDTTMLAFSRATGGGRNIWITDNVPESAVEVMSWGRVKALYR